MKRLVDQGLGRCATPASTIRIWMEKKMRRQLPASALYPAARSPSPAGRPRRSRVSLFRYQPNLHPRRVACVNRRPE